MNAAQESLARRFVACPDWRWLGGMRWRFDVASHEGIWSRYEGETYDRDGNTVVETPPSLRGPAIPDVEDPATLGCILALCRRHLNDDGFYVERSAADVWRGWCMRRGSRLTAVATTEAEALLHTLVLPC